MAIYGKAVAVYLLSAALYYATSFWRQHRKIRIHPVEESFSIVFAPVIIAGMFLTIPIAGIYFGLYPERHMTKTDMDGTEEEKARLAAYREYRKRVSFFGRIAEQLRIKPFDIPPEYENKK